MTQQFAMIIDSAKCFDCKGCMVSCKVANNVPDGFWRNWIKASTPDFSQGPATRTHFQPGGCMHCNQPTCVQACPTGATWKDLSDGTVRVDLDLCIGCGNCIAACPYDARYRHPQLKKVDKCDFCAERRAHGLLPACVDTCPTKARVFGDLYDPESEVSALFDKHRASLVQVVHPEYNTAPNMYYINATLPADWPRTAPPPRAMQAMTGFVNPFVKVATLLSGLGVAAMLGHQLLSGRKGKETETKKEDAA